MWSNPNANVATCRPPLPCPGGLWWVKAWRTNRSRFYLSSLQLRLAGFEPMCQLSMLAAKACSIGSPLCFRRSPTLLRLHHKQAPHGVRDAVQDQGAMRSPSIEHPCHRRLRRVPHSSDVLHRPENPDARRECVTILRKATGSLSRGRSHLSAAAEALSSGAAARYSCPCDGLLLQRSRKQWVRLRRAPEWP